MAVQAERMDGCIPGRYLRFAVSAAVAAAFICMYRVIVSLVQLQAEVILFHRETSASRAGIFMSSFMTQEG